MSVKSVYNFVPAPKENEVFKPDWAKQVSHDIPFSDGESGEIEIEIKAKTPIFIRNGHTKKDADEKNDRYLSFSHVERNGKKEFFIPGSSLKGMFRNVLEIISLSRINTANDIFGFRNLNHEKYKKEVATNKNIKTGWLVRENGQWILRKCDFGRIQFRSFRGESFQEKYSLENASVEYRFSEIKDLQYGRGVLFEKNNTGNFRGFLVFYGDIQNKKYEYIFTEPTGEEYHVSNDLINRFKDIDDKLENTQWQFFQSNNPYPQNRIPVFFLADEDTKEIKHFGFSRLYKMTNTKYVNELEPLNSYINRNKPYELDLTETIFGSIEDTDKKHGENRRKQLLKGRVYISHAFVAGDYEEMDKVSLVLASPKASYFPFYLKDKKNYLDDSEIRGFKKYPIHKKTNESDLNDENSDIETKIRPLKQDAKFKGNIRYHNLRKVELGALLSAITFHLHNDILDHNLGSAKPLGYGRVNIQITSKDIDVKKYIAAFEDIMQQYSLKSLHNNWLELPALKELYAMAIDPVNEFLLTYPKIENDNDFANYVRRNTYLEYYSEQYKNKELRFISIAEKYVAEKRKQERIENEIKRQKQEVNTLLSKADKYLEIKDYKTALEYYKKALLIDVEKAGSRIEQKIKDCNKVIKAVQNEYNNLISEADKLFKEQKWKDALDIYLKIIEIKPTEEYPRRQKNKCQNELDKENMSLLPLEKSNDFNKGKKIIEEYYKKATASTIISDNEQVKVLKDFIKRCIEKSNKRWKKAGKQDWVLVKKWLGPETARQWFDEMMQ